MAMHRGFLAHKKRAQKDRCSSADSAPESCPLASYFYAKIAVKIDAQYFVIKHQKKLVREKISGVLSIS